jgi:hypothetical protein
MEARSSATPSGAFSRPVEVDTDMESGGVFAKGAAALSRRRPVARPKVLSREQEYAFIKADMRRLVITASALFVLMIVLLFILD